MKQNSTHRDNTCGLNPDDVGTAEWLPGIRDARRSQVSSRIFIGLLFATGALLLASCSGSGDGSVLPPDRDRMEPHDPPRITGEVRVIDGDTVDVGGTRIRLWGIDAPERGQVCHAWGRAWNCGTMATEALTSRSEGLACEAMGTDRYGRTLGVCYSGGEDMNAWLVANGWALAYRSATNYMGEEEDARETRLGIHRGTYITPGDWRRGERPDTETGGIPESEQDPSLFAELPVASFGVMLRHGYVVPWVEGPNPETMLHGNRALTGTVNWTGSLIGLTPDGERVYGNSRITVDIETLTGGATFTDLEAWVDGTIVPRSVDELHYAIQVDGNTFHETGGDAGRLVGTFTGRNHKGAAGTLERVDLVAAFGAIRE